MEVNGDWSLIQVWINMSMSKCWQNCLFWVNCSFKCLDVTDLIVFKLVCWSFSRRRPVWRGFTLAGSKHSVDLDRLTACRRRAWRQTWWSWRRDGSTSEVRWCFSVYRSALMACWALASENKQRKSDLHERTERLKASLQITEAPVNKSLKHQECWQSSWRIKDSFDRMNLEFPWKTWDILSLFLNSYTIC